MHRLLNLKNARKEIAMNAAKTKRLLSAIFAFIFCISCLLTPVSAERTDIAAVSSGVALSLSSASACLMEASTGEVIYEQNADERLEPASVTKIMPLLLICEALDEGTLTPDEMVTGSEHAASMGGSQIWLEVGEQMSVSDMLKAMTVVSANDCTVAMAEHLAGSEEAFVARMNKRAEELGMANTHFVNATGLPVEGHYTTTRDIALMTRELLKHERIFEYTTIWMDSLRGGAMGLTNTNKLVRFYPGANGMKTGYTDTAKYCLSATAKRDKLQLIAAVMKAPTSEERFSDAKKLLDFGFANFSVYETGTAELPELTVKGGVKPKMPLVCGANEILVAKGREKQIEAVIELPEFLTAPVNEGEAVGKVLYQIEGETVAETDILTAESIRRMNFWDVVKRVLSDTFVLN